MGELLRIMFLKMEKRFQLAAQFSIPKLNNNGISGGDFLWLRSPFNNEEENLYKWVLQNLMTFIASKRSCCFIFKMCQFEFGEYYKLPII